MRLLQKYEGESNTTTCTNSSSNNKRRRKEEIKNVVSSSSRATTHNKVSALLILFMISILAFHIPMTSGLESNNNNNNNTYNNGSKNNNNNNNKKKNKGAHNRKQKQKQKVQRKAIVNGWSVNDVEKERFQFTTSIQYGSTHLCGGSLIAPDIVLSAAHCFHQMDGISTGDDDDNNDDDNSNDDDDNDGDIRFLRVTVGEFHLQNEKDGGESFSTNSVHVHPQYREADTGTGTGTDTDTDTDTFLEQDVAILKINGRSSKRVVRLNQNEHVPIPLPVNAASSSTSTSSSLQEHVQSQVMALGWGSLDVHGTIMANELQRVQLEYLSNQDCKESYGVPVSVVTDRMMCAFDLDGDSVVEDSCYGDSGGPLILSNPVRGSGSGTGSGTIETETQVGIVSFGSKRCGELPGVYTRISSVYEWIRESVCDVSSDPPDHFQCSAFTPTPTTPTPTSTFTSTPTEAPTIPTPANVVMEFDEGITIGTSSSPTNSPTRTAVPGNNKKPKNERIQAGPDDSNVPTLHVPVVVGNDSQQKNHDTSGSKACHEVGSWYIIATLLSLSFAIVTMGMGMQY